MLGSIAIAANTLTGPGMLELPAQYQRSGFIPTTVTIIIVCALSSFSALHMANVISKVPGNSNFTLEIEYSESFRIFWGRRWFIITEVAFTICIMCQLLASIVDTAQVVDAYMGSNTKVMDAVSLQVYPGPIRFIRWSIDACTNNDNNDQPTNATASVLDTNNVTVRQILIEEDDIVDNCVAFASGTDGGLILTGGYVLAAILFFPLGLLNLKENIIWQILGFLMLLVFSAQFIMAFIVGGLNFENLSMWGDTYTHMFGIIMFNFTVVTAIPAWLYEKQPSVSVPRGKAFALA